MLESFCASCPSQERSACLHVVTRYHNITLPIVSLLSVDQGVDYYHQWGRGHHLRRGEISSSSGLPRRLPDETACGVLSAVASAA